MEDKKPTSENPNRSELLGRLVTAVKSGEAPTAKEAEDLITAYPYFTLPAALYLRSNGASADEGRRRDLTRSVAMSSPNPEALYILLEPDAESHAGFYPDEQPSQPSTDNAIDTFLATYGTTTPEEEEVLNRMIFNPTPDYAQILAQEERDSLPAEGEAPAGSDDDLLNRFILRTKETEKAAHTPAPIPASTVESRISNDEPRPNPDDSLLSESLAKIFIKQRQYERAYEIISQLSLNFPEKSVYFADQLRFLRKVIENRRIRNQKTKQ